MEPPENTPAPEAKLTTPEVKKNHPMNPFKRFIEGYRHGYHVQQSHRLQREAQRTEPPGSLPKRITANILIGLFVLMTLGALSQAGKTQIEPGNTPEEFGFFIGRLLLFVGLFFSVRWKFKLSGHSHKVGRQTTAVILFWYSILAVLVGIAMPFVAKETFGYVFAAGMVLVWSFSAYLCNRWVRRLRAKENGLATTGISPEANASLIGAEPLRTPDHRQGVGKFVKAVAAITIASSLYIGLADKPFSFLFPDQSIDQTVITQSVVNVLCSSINGKDSGGSGTLITTDGSVITNSHVIPQNAKELLTTEKGCLVILPNSLNGQPEEMYWAKPFVIPELSENYDLAYLHIYDVFVDDKGTKHGSFPRTFQSIFSEKQNYDEICRLSSTARLGDPVRIYGYPQTSGGFNLTITDGVVSSLASQGVILTSAKVDAGNSGGLAVDKKGCMVGIPTAVTQGKYQNLGVITATSRVLEFSDAVDKWSKSR